MAFSIRLKIDFTEAINLFPLSEEITEGRSGIILEKIENYENQDLFFIVSEPILNEFFFSIMSLYFFLISTYIYLGRSKIILEGKILLIF